MEMSAVTASLCSTLLFVGLFVVVSADQKNITAESGQDVTLPCRAPNNNIIIVLEWSRADLEGEYVLLFRDEQFVPDDQHPSFKNRVDLQDRQMKDGDVSLILKDVTINDAGTYECRVKTGKIRRKRANLSGEPISIITLSVVDPPDQKIITAESGQNVTLTCRAPNNKIIVVEWSRADLGDEYVYMYRDEGSVLEGQHPSFRNRVDLQDRQMKDGDVSLILKNVTTNDTGTYECRVKTGRKRKNRAILNDNPISIITLSVVDPPDQKIITAATGQNVTLPCRAPNNNIILVDWSRADLEDEYVLLYRDDQFLPDEQHPSFKNRVDLQDRQMKDGDVSLILKDVMINDTGTYECRVETVTKLRKRASLDTDPISIITLSVVDPPGQPGGHAEDGSVGLVVGLSGVIVRLSVSAVLLVAVVGFLIYRKPKQQNQDPY